MRWLHVRVSMAAVLSSGVFAAQVRADATSVQLLGADNRALDESRDALGIAQTITNDGSLPVGFERDATSGDANDVRLEVTDPALSDNETWASIESASPADGKPRSELRLRLKRPRAGLAFRSQFVRLVGDEVDLHASSVQAQTLLVALRDVVQVRYQTPSGDITRTFRVGAAGDAASPRAARLVRLRAHVLRQASDGLPAAGSDANGAIRLIQAQLRTANEIWLQCHMTFGEPSELSIEVVAPPPASMIAIADGDGLPARGAGVVRFSVDGVAIGPIVTRALASPLETANDVARALRAAGFSPNVTQNARTRFGAGASADVLVLRRDGSAATLTPLATAPLTTDARQRIEIVTVDLRDGLSEFDNMNAQAGTAEERALIRALADDDPSTIDLFIVNRFTGATRQGEAFIQASARAGASIVNTVILDRQGLRHSPLAWTLAHEVGHVLLDDPLHPDNVGPDRPWLLMDADNSRGTVNGPKRLRPEDCARVRERAAALLVPYDVGSK